MKATKPSDDAQAEPSPVDEDESDQAARLGGQLWSLHGEFQSHMDKLEGQWLPNFKNAHVELVNVLRLGGSEMYGSFAPMCYVDPPDWDGLRALADLTSWDIDELTMYGQMVVNVRFCAGYLGNLAQGDAMKIEQCAALIFAYEAYWRFGDDYVLGCVVEALLRRIGRPERWAAEPGSDEKSAVERVLLAREVGTAMIALFSHHLSTQPGSIEASLGGSRPKPELIDFRSKLLSIKPPRRAPAKKT